MFRKALLIIGLSGALGTPAFAQFDFGFGGGFPGGGFGGGSPGGASAGATGAQRRDTDRTGAQAWQDFTPDVNQGIAPSAFPGQTFTTGRGTLNAGDIVGPALPETTTTQYGVGPGVTVNINQLPPTKLSSFVADSGFDENIYGDEGTTALPPIDGFQYENTIGAGVVEPYLSTGHASPLPSAWLETGNMGNSPGPMPFPGGGFPGGGFPGGGFPGGGFPGGPPGIGFGFQF